MAEEFASFDLQLDDDDFFFDFDFDPSVFTDSPPPTKEFVQSSPDSWIGEIENQLMNDENQEEQNFLELDQESVSEFIADLLVDSPINDSGTVESPDAGKVSDDSGKENTDLCVEKKKKTKKSNDSGSEIHDDEENDDAVAKKRTRRVRNRDAAVRSRERKKEYVEDLEKKSKYLERECLRLGRMLECFVAENQSLRYCLQKGNGNNTSVSSKQESAVLLLESLLLGSLLWLLLGVNFICLFPYLSHTKCYLIRLEPGKLVLNGLGSSSKVSYTGVSRRCKGSRPRMKQKHHQVLTLVV